MPLKLSLAAENHLNSSCLLLTRIRQNSVYDSTSLQWRSAVAFDDEIHDLLAYSVEKSDDAVLRPLEIARE